MSKASKGKPKSEEHKKALSIAKIGKKRKPHSEETRKKMSETQKRIAINADYSARRTDEYRAKQSENSKKVWARIKAKKLSLQNI